MCSFQRTKIYILSYINKELELEQRINRDSISLERR